MHYLTNRKNLINYKQDLQVTPLSTVKVMALIRPLHHGLVRLLEILRRDHVPVPANSAQPCLCADRRDLGRIQPLRSPDEVLELYVRRELHLGSGRGEDQAPLATVRQRELDLAVQSPRAHQSRVERVGAVCGHDHFDIGVLVKAIHLVQKLEHYALDFAVGGDCGVVSGHADRIDFAVIFYSFFI